MPSTHEIERHLVAAVSQRKSALSPLPSPSQHCAVLIALGRDGEAGELQVLLTKRTETVETHKGQVSFPGGWAEPQDLDLLATALRESHEELGLAAKDVTIVGRMEPVATRAQVLIYPWVGFFDLPYLFDSNPDEVARVLLLPCSRLISEGLVPVELDVGAGKKFKSVGIDVDGELVWGATARMLEQLRQLLRA